MTDAHECGIKWQKLCKFHPWLSYLNITYGSTVLIIYCKPEPARNTALGLPTVGQCFPMINLAPNLKSKIVPLQQAQCWKSILWLNLFYNVIDTILVHKTKYLRSFGIPGTHAAVLLEPLCCPSCSCSALNLQTEARSRTLVSSSRRPQHQWWVVPVTYVEAWHSIMSASCTFTKIVISGWFIAQMLYTLTNSYRPTQENCRLIGTLVDTWLLFAGRDSLSHFWFVDRSHHVQI